MPKHLLIIGGGHAGSSAALGAARQRQLLNKDVELSITLINSTPYLGIRPRYYEYELEATQVALTDFLKPINVTVIVATATDINLQEKSVTYLQQQQQQILNYDSIVLAAGSELVQPKIPGLEEYSFNIDSFIAACRFRAALEQTIIFNKTNLLRIAVLGGGLTGIELATELPSTVKKICNKFNKPIPKLEAYILDRNQISKNLGEQPSSYIEEALHLANIQTIDYASINQIKSASVIFNKNSELNVDMIVSTLGMRANHLTNNLNIPKDVLGRIKVNSYLEIPDYPLCFAAGDIALSKVDPNHDSIMSCQQGRPQGRYAGHNAVSALYTQTLLAYSQPNYVTCLDLGEYGALYTEGWDREVKLIKQAAKKIKQHINCDRIYPPKSLTTKDLLEAGTPEFLSPVQTLDKK